MKLHHRHEERCIFPQCSFGNCKWWFRWTKFMNSHHCYLKPQIASAIKVNERIKIQFRSHFPNRYYYLLQNQRKVWSDVRHIYRVNWLFPIRRVQHKFPIGLRVWIYVAEAQRTSGAWRIITLCNEKPDNSFVGVGELHNSFFCYLVAFSSAPRA